VQARKSFDPATNAYEGVATGYVEGYADESWLPLCARFLPLKRRPNRVLQHPNAQRFDEEADNYSAIAIVAE